jgi:hypothetical protein
MVEKYQSDIIVEGNGLSASVLAYYLSLNTDDVILAIQREEKESNTPHFIPGFSFPQFDLPFDVMEKVFRKTRENLNDFHSLSGHFEISSNPLVATYRDRNYLNLMEEHKAKLKNTSIQHNILDISDISTYYPFISRQEDIFLIEIFNSITCANINELSQAFQKFAKENEVVFTKETSNLKIDLKNKKLLSENSSYDANKYITVTSKQLLSTSSHEEIYTLDISTPVFEKFPRINLIDFYNDSYMWLEEAGYFHIFRLFNNNNEKQCIKKIEEDFEKIFPHLGKLEIADSSFVKQIQCSHLEKSIGTLGSETIHYFSLPLQSELSLITVLAENYSKKIAENKLSEIGDFNAINLLS